LVYHDEDFYGFSAEIKSLQRCFETNALQPEVRNCIPEEFAISRRHVDATIACLTRAHDLRTGPSEALIDKEGPAKLTLKSVRFLMTRW